MAPSSDFVMQTLGAIVQAYASILAIAGAFYIFIIERNKTEEKGAKENLEELYIEFINNYLTQTIQNNAPPGMFWTEQNKKYFLDLKNNVIANGENILLKAIKNRFRLPDDEITVFKENINYKEFFNAQKSYLSQKNKLYKWISGFFNPVAIISAIILAASIFTMYLISIQGSINALNALYTLYVIIVIGSLLGIIVFTGLIYSILSN